MSQNELISIIDCDLDNKESKYSENVAQLGANTLLEIDFVELARGELSFGRNEIIVIDISQVENKILKENFSVLNEEIKSPFKVFVDSASNYDRSNRDFEVGDQYVHIFQGHEDLFQFVISIIEDFKFQKKASKNKPKEDLSHIATELSDRLNIVADSLDELRINSVSEFTDELRVLSQVLKDNNPIQPVEKRTIRKLIHEALLVFGNILDVAQHSKITKMALCGAISAIVGLGGWSSTACYIVTLAAWQGKDAFITAIQNLPVSNNGASASGKTSRSRRNTTTKTRKKPKNQPEIPNLE